MMLRKAKGKREKILVTSTELYLGDYILAVPMKAFSGHDGGERNVGSHHLADGELSR